MLNKLREGKHSVCMCAVPGCLGGNFFLLWCYRHFMRTFLVEGVGFATLNLENNKDKPWLPLWLLFLSNSRLSLKTRS